MRVISLCLASAALVSCTSAPYPVTRSPDKQAEFQQLVGGKVAQASVTCVPHWSTDDMHVIDDNTVVFKDGAYRSYVAHLNGGCNGLANGSYTMVTKQFGGPDLCSGQIATVIDPITRTLVGSCSFENFQPFVRPGA